MPVAFSYVRFSTPAQASGDSLRRQVARSEEYCRRHKLELDRTLTLRDLGVSGFRGKHVEQGALGAFLRAVDTGRVRPGSLLLVENLDRLSRQKPSEAVPLFLRIVNSGVKLVVLDSGKTFTRDSIDENEIDLVIAIMELGRGNRESKRKSDLLVAAYAGKREALAKGEKPLMGRYPRWIDLVDGKFVLIPDRVAVVKRMVKLAIDGYGANTIAALFNREGVKPMGDRDVETWGAPTVYHILRSRRLIGEYQPHKLVDGRKVPAGDPVPNYYPRAVSDREFYRLQLSLEKRKMVGRRNSGKLMTNVFGDLLVCGNDDSRIMVVESVNAARTRRRHTMVSDKMLRGITARVGFDYSTFEAHFLRWVTEVRLKDHRDEPHDRVGQLEQQIAGLDSNRKALQGRLLKAAADAFESGVALLEQLDTQRARLAAELEKARAEAELPKVDTSNVKKLMAKLQAAEGEERYLLRSRLRLAIADVVERVEVFMYGSKNNPRVCVAVVTLRDGTYRTLAVGTHRYWGESRSLEITDKSELASDYKDPWRPEHIRITLRFSLDYVMRAVAEKPHVRMAA